MSVNWFIDEEYISIDILNSTNYNIGASTIDKSYFRNTQLKGLKGIDNAYINSIIVSDPSGDRLLEGEEAKTWLKEQAWL